MINEQEKKKLFVSFDILNKCKAYKYCIHKYIKQM